MTDSQTRTSETANDLQAASVLHPSARAVIADLRARFPSSPLLALGQTVLWDEPTKAVLLRALHTEWPDAHFVAGTHDTDYFAKLPGHTRAAHDRGKYALVLHDDAKTRGLWSAAGEMSQLFGSEDVPTRDALENRGGVFLYRALAANGGVDSDFLLGELTAAWGWTGIIYTEWDRKIVRDVLLADILPTLLEQVDWATQGSVACLQGERAQSAQTVAQTIKGWITAFARTNPGASLADLYRYLSPKFYGLLLHQTPARFSTAQTTELLRFNRETARLPRFQFVDLFLNPITRRMALDSYNLAVGGTDTYTLDKFGEGALPFDLVIPGKGRGTLCLPGDGTIFVDTPREPIVLCDKGCDFADVEKLAALVERELGPDVSLVGKAVSLLPMLAAEFIIVFHEGASGYSDRTQKMMARLATRNVGVPNLRPIVRMKYATWDALAAVPSVGNGAADAANDFFLPSHLAQSFGHETLSIHEFGLCWKFAQAREEKRLADISELRSPRDVMDYLSHQPGKGSFWAEKRSEHSHATVRLLALRDQAQAIQGRIYTLYDQMRRVKAEADQLERAKGDDFRARIEPLRARLAQADNTAEADALSAQIEGLQSERTFTYDVEIASRRGQVRFALATVRELKAKRLLLERGTDATEARRTIRRIEAEAELSKARIVRNALQTLHGLPHTNFRPSAWWFPLVDPSGAWFRRLTETTEFYLEPLG